MLSSADLVTVTTDELLKKVRNHRPNGKIEILQNLINFDHIPSVKKQSNNKIKILWQGAASHYENLKMVQPELVDFSMKHPEVEFIIKGVSFASQFDEINERVKWIPWDNNVSDYYASLGELACDIAICPLTDIEFNKGKSPLKWEEMSAMKIPCVCSPTMFSNFVEHGKTGYIAKKGEWATYLELLLDKKKREEIGNNAYNTIRKDYSIEKAANYCKPIWLNCF